MKNILIIATSIMLPTLSGFAGDSSCESVLIKAVPHIQQKPDFCGEACAAMALHRLGFKHSQNDVYNASGLDPINARGCHTKELNEALKQIGFKTGAVWTTVTADSQEDITARWENIHADLVKDVPSIVCMRTSNTASANEHFRLILGYDADKKEVIYHEPAERNAAYRRMSLNSFLETWPLKYSTRQWTTIRLKLEPGRITNPPTRTGFTDADFAQHMMQLKKKIPDKTFSVVIQKPFVVIGDEPANMVKIRAEKTVKWATDKLKSAYFNKDPEHIIDIWLFKDNKSYRKHAWSIFGDRPDTPYGYSSSEHRALIMNIGTGGGTLVHEIVHPFIAANFPDCPAWFNEGLGSLYEQSASRDGNIVGLTNWRLAGLQKTIRAGSLPSFKELTGTSTHEFYNRDSGTNYAQARYLCYYLQEKNLLRNFYHQFHSDHKKDPTGYRTLQAVLKTNDMPGFQKKWEAYTLKLRFP